MSGEWWDETMSPEKAQRLGAKIHPTAIVSEQAKLAEGVTVGPHAIVGPNVVLKPGVKIAAGAVITGVTTIGEETVVHAYATIGAPPQDLKYKNEPTRCLIGARNQIREYVNISVGTITGNQQTVIGDDNLVMAYTHIAHDCIIGNRCIFANGVQIAGHVEIGNYVVFGGMSGGHQFCRFGDYAMIAAGSIVVQDVVPYAMVHGDHASINGLNVVGLRRAGFTGPIMESIKLMNRILFKSNLTLEQAIQEIKDKVPESEQKKFFVNFIATGKRGLCR